jgi:hypothetical protein
MLGDFFYHTRSPRNYLDCDPRHIFEYLITVFRGRGSAYKDHDESKGLPLLLVHTLDVPVYFPSSHHITSIAMNRDILWEGD